MRITIRESCWPWDVMKVLWLYVCVSIYTYIYVHRCRVSIYIYICVGFFYKYLKYLYVLYIYFYIKTPWSWLPTTGSMHGIYFMNIYTDIYIYIEFMYICSTCLQAFIHMCIIVCKDTYVLVLFCLFAVLHTYKHAQHMYTQNVCIYTHASYMSIQAIHLAVTHVIAKRC